MWRLGCCLAQYIDMAHNICKNGVVDNNLTLGEYIRHLRRRKGWNLQELAKETGLSHSHLSRLENDNNLPNPETVVKLAGVLGGDLDQMLALAKCLPQEILERLIHRADTSSAPLRRSAGSDVDPSFHRALVEEIDPSLRSGLAQHFGLSETDVDGIIGVLQRMRQLEPAQRAAMVELLAAFSSGRHEDGSA